jgi:tetratricopeptide (TPR) repeat protein
LKYYEACYTSLSGDETGAEKILAEAAARSVRCCFPNRLEDISVLEFACTKNPQDGHAPYLLGNLFYDKKQYQKAIELWEKASAADPRNPTVHRNLALAYFNKSGDPVRARAELETAFSLDKTDARVFMELDQLYKKLGVSPAERLSNYDKNGFLYKERDDLYTEYITLLNLLSRHEEALALIENHIFHPWEGGEGKITAQYAKAKTELAKAKILQGGLAAGDLAAGDLAAAIVLLEEALVFPENLGEGKLTGARDSDIYYWLGMACEKLGKKEQAAEAFEKAAAGDEEPAGMMFYNDQPADLILYQGLANHRLGRDQQARSRFNKLLDYGEKHIFDKLRIDYFAVSLPDLQLFEDDLDKRNVIHCRYLIALGSLGLGDLERAKASLKETLEKDPAHLGAVLHQKLTGWI